MTSKADTLPLETEPVAHDNNTFFTLKPGYQTYVAPDNPSNQFYKSKALQITLELYLFCFLQGEIIL